MDDRRTFEVDLTANEIEALALSTRKQFTESMSQWERDRLRSALTVLLWRLEGRS